MKILLSGFAPFGKDWVNPSWEAVRRLDGVQLSNHTTLLATQLPVTFNGAARRLIASIRAIEPDIVLAVGQATGRAEITPEREAHNYCDSSCSDNAGHLFTDSVILPQGPDTYLSTLPYQEMIGAIRQIGIPASLSHSAGGYVCNHVFYHLMNYLEKMERRKILGGFLHVPCLPEQTMNTDVPSLTLEQITEAVREAARVSSEVCISVEHEQLA
ncbi:pyroglutamyl-peptidase I [Sporolactobacillus spathodeae]|uniref:Pyroglutamyl-peptidase I n=1 Tax=Sporolactobacillus spathodeae TaxID=1465502 RepID=A0ABS2Q757_9BACL|nr:pyroglutamyl-peptidase [Sporolactobacillus spathodeae]